MRLSRHRTGHVVQPARLIVAPNCPAYVACVTDFSPNRASPLDREIRVSDSREQIEELYAQLKAKDIADS